MTYTSEVPAPTPYGWAISPPNPFPRSPASQSAATAQISNPFGSTSPGLSSWTTSFPQVRRKPPTELNFWIRMLSRSAT